MQNRRQILQKALAIPFAMGSVPLTFASATRDLPLGVLVLEDGSCLSRESAEGFRFLFKDHPASGLLVATGLAKIAHKRAEELRSFANCGAWIIWESPAYFEGPEEARRQAQMLRGTFGITVDVPPSPESNARQTDLYVRYHWPVPHLIRKFGSVVRVAGEPCETVASYQGETVALKKRIGLGGVIFLGSMLGPQLKAEDREAHCFGAALVRSLA